MEMIWSVVRRGLSCWWEWVSRRRHAERWRAQRWHQGRMERCRCCQTFPRDHQRFGNLCPVKVTNHVLEVPFELSGKIFLKNSKTGAAAGPSGMTAEHLRVLLESRSLLHAELARADVPTALRKADGGVRGIVAGGRDPQVGGPDDRHNN